MPTGLQDIREKIEYVPPDDERWITPREGIPLVPNEDGEEPGLYHEATGSQSPYTDNFSIDTSSASLVVRFPFEQRSSAISSFLGYSYVDGDKLLRVLPIAHPYWEFLRCRRVVNCRGLQWRGDDPKEPQDLGAAFRRPYFAEYTEMEATLCFEPLPFTLKTDDQVEHEYERYVYVRTEPNFDTLWIEGGGENSFKFDTADAAFNEGAPAFPGGRALPYAQPRVLCTWYDVPLEWITANGDPKPGYYPNIYEGLTKINDAEFLGFPAYTLLMQNPIIDLRPNPLPTDVATEATFLANVTFVWEFKDPRPLGTGVSESLGHNMAPFRGDYSWYPISVNGAGSQRPYDTYDFAKLFEKPE